MDQRTLVENLRKARKARGLTRPEVEQAIGIPIRTLAHWESVGEPDPPALKLRALAVLYGVSTDELLGLDGPTTPDTLLYCESRLVALEDLRDRGMKPHEIPADFLSRPGLNFCWVPPASARAVRGAERREVEQRIRACINRK